MSAEQVTVDTGVTYEGFATLAAHQGNPLSAVKAAYNDVAAQVQAVKREPVLIRVLVHVAPRALDFESDTPLTGGACSLDGPCESCQ